MLKQTIFFSKPCKLSLRLKQLIIEREDLPQPVSRPIEDLSVVIIENQQVSVTMPLLNELARNNVVVIICDEHFMPAIQLTPLEANATQQEAYRYQLNASVPLMKKMWKELIEAKIQNQALLLESLKKDASALKPLYSNVKSGDSGNAEGIAARIYWQLLFGAKFTRERYGESPNELLNYGYTILRAATARALMGAGLNLAFGLFHHNKYNPFPLADDVMEPFRPYVDNIVYHLKGENPNISLTSETKSALINVIYQDVYMSERRHPLQIALSMTAASMLKVFKAETNHLTLPKFSP